MLLFFFFFFNDTATTEISTLSLHDALPIFMVQSFASKRERTSRCRGSTVGTAAWGTMRDLLAGREVSAPNPARSEEHTSELQSRQYLVCRLLLEKKKYIHTSSTI